MVKVTMRQDVNASSDESQTQGGMDMHTSMERQNLEDHIDAETRSADVIVGSVDDFMGTDLDRACRIEALALGYVNVAKGFTGSRRDWRLRRAVELMQAAWAMIGLDDTIVIGPEWISES